MKRRNDLFREYVEQIAGHNYVSYNLNENPSLFVMTYANVPEIGQQTAFTIGLSNYANDRWRLGKPELLVSVNSLDSCWPLAMGELVLRASGSQDFSVGQIFKFGSEISSESQMDAFLLYYCIVLEREDAVYRDSDGMINIVQLFPIYTSEIDEIKRMGSRSFLTRMGESIYDVHRQPIG